METTKLFPAYEADECTRPRLIVLHDHNHRKYPQNAGTRYYLKFYFMLGFFFLLFIGMYKKDGQLTPSQKYLAIRYVTQVCFCYLR